MRMYRRDRCGELVSASYKGFVRKPSRGVHRFGKKRHLCHDCSDDFRRWIKGCRLCNLLSGMGVADFTPYVAMCRTRNEERGRFDG